MYIRKGRGSKSLSFDEKVAVSLAAQDHAASRLSLTQTNYREILNNLLVLTSFPYLNVCNETSNNVIVEQQLNYIKSDSLEKQTYWWGASICRQFV